MSSSRVHTTLTGTLDLLRDADGLFDMVDLQPAPKTTAHEQVVGDDTLERETGDLGSDGLRP